MKPGAQPKNNHLETFRESKNNDRKHLCHMAAFLGTKSMFCNHLIQMRVQSACYFYSSNRALQQATVPPQKTYHLNNNIVVCVIKGIL